MKQGSLFSGIGGFDLGFERAGIKTEWQCEIDPFAQKILQKQFGKKVYNDVREIRKGNTNRVDILSGGFPCQDVSIAGKRAGLAGERSGLWFEFARVIDELEPSWVVIENVPGLLSSNGGRDFAVIIQGLVKSGYGVSWRVLDAQYFGVPQRRRRVFIVASFGNGRSAEVLFERESGSGHPSTRKEKREGVAETFTIRSGKDGGGKGYLGLENKAMTLGGQQQWLASGKDVSPTLMSNYGTKYGLGNQEAFSGDYHIINLANSGANQNNVKKSHVSDTLDTWVAQAVAWLEDDENHDNEVYRETGDKTGALMARMGTCGNNVPLVGLRRLTPIECERLQGFPDGWTEGQSDKNRYKQLGNAVAVPVAEWIGKRIIMAEQWGAE